MKYLIPFSFVLLFQQNSSFANVDRLFLSSLKVSKKVEVIQLTENKILSELAATSSTLFPSLDLVNVNKYESDYEDASSGDNGVDTQLALSMNHKLFQGGAEFAINDYRKIVPKQALAQKKLELSQFYRDFTMLYFKYASANEEAKKLKILLGNLKKRVKIVRERTRIGKDRKADLFALQSQLHRLNADYITSVALLKSSKINFLNFSGLKNIDDEVDSLNPENLKLKEKINFENIPSLKNLKLSEETASFETRIEKATNYPQVDFGANYYLDKTRSGTNDWDVSLNIRFNLLDFGERNSKVESKKVSRIIQKAHYDYGMKNVSRVWKNYLNNFESKKNELNLLKRALKRSEASYKEQLKDLDKGLVTQIDVIRSLDDVVSLEKLSIKSSAEVKTLYYQAIAYLGNYPKE